jgi:hypothetical protein
MLVEVERVDFTDVPAADVAAVEGVVSIALDAMYAETQRQVKLAEERRTAEEQAEDE